MSRLSELVAKYYSEKTFFCRLKEIANVSIGEFIHKSLQSPEAPYPVYNGGITNTGFYEKSNRTANKIIISARGANAGYVNRVFCDFWSGNSCYTIEIIDSRLDWSFVYYWIKNNEKTLLGEQQKGGIPAVSKKQVEDLLVPIPPLEVQNEVVRILDSFTELTEELTEELAEELAARKNQYEYYRDSLLTYNMAYPQGKLIDMLRQPITDGPHTTPLLVESGVPFLSVEAVYDGGIHFENRRGYITEEFDEECCKKYKPQKHDVFIVKSGSTTGKVGYVDTDERFNIWSPLAALRVNHSNSSRYLFHLLQSSSIQNQVRQKASHGSQPNLSMRVLEQFDVVIPPLEIQLRIADVLDNFDAICTELNIGLPAEIEARQKQYEYYRDKLLTFPSAE